MNYYNLNIRVSEFFLFRWIHNNTLQFNSARKYLPNNIKLHLGSRINRLEPKVSYSFFNSKLSTESFVISTIKTLTYFSI